MARSSEAGAVLPTLDAALGRVERALRDAVTADDPFLTEIASHLITAGGKRARPALTVASGSVGYPEGPVPEEIVLGGVAVELVHLGSLYHDDVMDEADTRRTVESVNHRWGNLTAILAGDFLLARASGIAAGLGPEVAALLAVTIARLCEGQVSELQRTFDPGRSEDDYCTAISGKTASLFAAACRIGGLTAGLAASQVEALTEFGDAFGMAFQVVDDVLDVVATDEQLGKPAGNDLVEGVYTLPVIRALAAPGGDELRERLGRPLSPDEVEVARTIVRKSGAVEDALGFARLHLDLANEALDGLPAGPGRDHLRSAAAHLLDSIPI